jgi:hypothetical protein
MAIAVDDNDCIALLRLFNEDAGKEYLTSGLKLDKQQIDSLAYMGISGIANMLCCIKFAKYYELGESDVVFTVLTDSVDMYHSRLEELREEEGPYTKENAIKDHAESLQGETIDNMLELGYQERKRIHNLKYYTWVEQQGKTMAELNELWDNQEKNFLGAQTQVEAVDALINEFNQRTGLL